MSSYFTKNSIIRILAAIVIVVFIASILYLFRLKKTPTEIGAGRRYTAAGEKIPAEVYSYNGIVEEVNEDKLNILSTSGSNYIPVDMRFTIIVRDDTKVFKYFVVATAGQEGYPKIEQKEVQFKEVNVGDTIMIYSKESIKGDDSFEVDNLVILP